MTFEQFWAECLALAKFEMQRVAMSKCKNFYYEYWEEGLTPEEAFEEEWGG